MADFNGTSISTMTPNVMGATGVTSAVTTGDVAMRSTDGRIALWNKRAGDFDTYAQQFQSRWSAYWKWYRAWKQPLTEPLDWWRSNEVIPTLFKVIETLTPRYVFGLFDRPDWLSLRGTEGSDEILELSIQQLIREQFEEMEMLPTSLEGLKYMEIMGHVWWKLPWKEEYRSFQMLEPQLEVNAETGEPLRYAMRKTIRLEKIADRPNLSWCMLDKIKTATDGSGRWFIEEIKTTLEELQEENTRLGGIYNNLAMIPGGAGTGSIASAGMQGGWREPESTEGIPQQFVDVKDGTPLLLWQCWGWVPPQYRQPGEGDWRLTVIADRHTIIRDVDAPTPDGRPPYFGTKSVPIPGQLFGDSILHWIGPMADQQTRLANMRMDDVTLSVWGQLMISNAAGITNNELFQQPGGVLWVNGDPNTMVAPLKRQPTPNSAWLEDDYREQKIEHAAGAADLAQGIPESSRPTTGDTQIRASMGAQRIDAKVLWLQETFIKPLVTRVFRWLQMRMPDERIFRIVGSDGFIYDMPLDIRSIQIPVDISVGGGILGLTRQTRIEQFQEMLQLAASPIFGPYLRADAVMMDMFRERGKLDVRRYIRSEQEVYALQTMGMGAEGLGSGQPGMDAGAPQNGVGMEGAGGGSGLSLPSAGQDSGMGQGAPAY
jgi:hypothetical protein